MTAIPNNTLQKQIERGEVYYLNAYTQLDPNTHDTILISTGAAQTSLLVEVVGPTNFDSTLTEGVTATDGAATSTQNMNLNGGGSMTATVHLSPSGISGGTARFSVYYTNGVPQRLSPFTRDTGVILQPSTKHTFVTNHTGPDPVTFQINMFLREL